MCSTAATKAANGSASSASATAVLPSAVGVLAERQTERSRTSAGASKAYLSMKSGLTASNPLQRTLKWVMSLAP